MDETPLTQLGQGQTACAAQVPQLLAEGNKIYVLGLNKFLLIFHDKPQSNLLFWKEVKIFTLLGPSDLRAARRTWD